MDKSSSAVSKQVDKKQAQYRPISYNGVIWIEIWREQDRQANVEVIPWQTEERRDGRPGERFCWQKYETAPPLKEESPFEYFQHVWSQVRLFV